MSLPLSLPNFCIFLSSLSEGELNICEALLLIVGVALADLWLQRVCESTMLLLSNACGGWQKTKLSVQTRGEDEEAVFELFQTSLLQSS